MSRFFFLGGDLTDKDNYQVQDPSDPSKYVSASATPGDGDTVVLWGPAESGSMSFNEILSDAGHGYAIGIAGADISVATIDAQTSDITISAGGSLSISSPFSLGSQSGSDMTITVRDAPGASSSLSYSGDLVVGGVAKGHLVIEDAASVSLDGLVVGQSSGSLGGVSVSGADTYLEIANDVVLGRAGTGSLGVSDGAEMIINGDLTTRDDPGGSASSGVVVTNDGHLTVNGLTTIGRKGVDALSQLYGGGRLDALGGLTIADYSGGSQLSFWLQDDSRLYTGSSTVRVGSAGRGVINLFDSSAFLSDSGGTVILGDQSGSSGKLNVGFSITDTVEGSTGFQADALIVGKGGSGTLRVYGHREAHVTGDLYVGEEGGSSGSIVVEKGGLLAIHRALLGMDKTAGGSISIDGRSTLSDSDSVHSLLQFDGVIGIGSEGTGQFSVTDGGEAKGTGKNAELLVGVGAGSTGILSASGTDTVLTAQDVLFGGAKGIGVGDIHGGASVTIRNKLGIGSGVAPASDAARNALLVVGAERLPLENFEAGGERDDSQLTVGGAVTVGTKAGAGSLWIARGAEATFQSTFQVGGRKTGTLELLDGGSAILDPGSKLVIGAKGTINARAGGGEIDGKAAITNNGDIEVHDDSDLAIMAKSIGGAGQMFVDFNAVLTLSGAVAASQSVTFSAGAGGNGQLILGDAAHFKATIKSFQEGDGIGLLDLTARSVKSVGTKAIFTLSDHSKITLQFDKHIDTQDFVLTQSIAGTAIGIKAAHRYDSSPTADNPEGRMGPGPEILRQAAAGDLTGHGDRHADTHSRPGGRDAEPFLFDTRSAAGSDADMVRLDHALFSELDGQQTLSPGQFCVGPAARDGSDRIVYDAETGALSYDADGNGPAIAFEITQLEKHLALTHADFIVV